MNGNDGMRPIAGPENLQSKSRRSTLARMEVQISKAPAAPASASGTTSSSADSLGRFKGSDGR